MHPIQINSWQHEPDLKFLGRKSPEFSYGFNLSRPFFESNLQFNVGIKHTYSNVFNGVFFLAQTVSVFEVKEEEEPPKADELFALVDERTRPTNLSHDQIANANLQK
ncbi:MAG: hypothetical protein M3O71_32375 [Bacteroidota bacterium]|nr:hypothetical protein [Bacteroidota bacterium]